MKSRVLILPVFSILIILASTILTYQVFSFYQKTPEDTSPEAIITQVIPDKIEPLPKVIYNPSLGIVESYDSPQLALMLEDYNLALNRIYRVPLNFFVHSLSQPLQSRESLLRYLQRLDAVLDGIHLRP